MTTLPPVVSPPKSIMIAVHLINVKLFDFPHAKNSSLPVQIADLNAAVSNSSSSLSQ